MFRNVTDIFFGLLVETTVLTLKGARNVLLAVEDLVSDIVR